MTTERVNKLFSDYPHNNVITVTGISSSGKDYLVNLASQREPELIGKQISLFQFGYELFKLINKNHTEKLTNERDGLKTLSSDSIEGYVEIALDKLLSLQPVVQLTHIAVSQRDKYIINPKSEVKTLAKAYIFIETDPELIYWWRKTEQTTRHRPVELIDDIEVHQGIALAATTLLSRRLGSAMFVVHNDYAETDENVSQINGIVRELLSE